MHCGTMAERILESHLSIVCCHIQVKCQGRTAFPNELRTQCNAVCHQKRMQRQKVQSMSWCCWVLAADTDCSLLLSLFVSIGQSFQWRHSKGFGDQNIFDIKQRGSRRGSTGRGEAFISGLISSKWGRELKVSLGETGSPSEQWWGGKPGQRLL